MASWHQLQIAIRKQVEADPELQQLKARYIELTKGRAGSPPQQQAERAYLDRLWMVEAQAQLDQTTAVVDAERAAKAEYMREYRASKRAARQLVDTARKEQAR